MKRVVLVCAALFLVSCRQHAWEESRAVATEIQKAKTDQLSQNIARQPRKVYNYSVIAGGVADAAEVHHRLKSDPVAAHHYSDVRVADLRPALLEANRKAYVSYRTRHGIFWTVKPVHLAKDELVLSDGKNEIRGRCGNRISDTPQEPVAHAEPDAELEQFAWVPNWAIAPEIAPSFFGPVGVILPSDPASEPVTPALFAQVVPTEDWFTVPPPAAAPEDREVPPLIPAPPAFMTGIIPPPDLPEKEREKPILPPEPSVTATPEPGAVAMILLAVGLGATAYRRGS